MLRQLGGTQRKSHTVCWPEGQGKKTSLSASGDCGEESSPGLGAAGAGQRVNGRGGKWASPAQGHRLTTRGPCWPRWVVPSPIQTTEDGRGMLPSRNWQSLR